jgi:hypothetical protein
LGGSENSAVFLTEEPELLGVASFAVSGNSFTIPSRFRMVWRTRGPIQRDLRHDIGERRLALAPQPNVAE